MKRHALVLVLTLLASACVSGPANSSEPTAETLSADGRWAHRASGLPASEDAISAFSRISVRTHLTGAPSFEPTIGISSTGTMFTIGVVRVGQEPPFNPFGGSIPHLLISKDEGRNWTKMPAALATGHDSPPRSGDPFLHVDSVTGRVYTLDLPALTCTWLKYSDDEGKTWTHNPIGCGQPASIDDHQSLTTGIPRGIPPTGYPRMVYTCTNAVAAAKCAASHDGGLTFGPSVPVFLMNGNPNATPSCAGLSGHVTTDQQGRVLLPKGDCGVPSVAFSEDDGVTWTKRAISPSHRMYLGDHDVTIGTDEKTWYAAWISEEGRVLLSSTSDLGRTWSEPIVVSPAEVTAAAHVALAVGDSGRVVVGYLGTHADGGYARKDWAGVGWHAFLTLVPDARRADPDLLTARLTPESDPLTVGACGRAFCSRIGDFIGFAISPEGSPWLATVDTCIVDCPQTGKNSAADQGFVGTIDGIRLRGAWDLSPG
jgi:hypothetical protein